LEKEQLCCGSDGLSKGASVGHLGEKWTSRAASTASPAFPNNKNNNQPKHLIVKSQIRKKNRKKAMRNNEMP
jgi:hypothetical protein